jgi:hypothetical protein
MKIRAAQSGQSLQAYLRSLIVREAARPTVAEAVEQARRQATADISTTDILLRVPLIIADARIKLSGIARCEVEVFDAHT